VTTNTFTLGKDKIPRKFQVYCVQTTLDHKIYPTINFAEKLSILH